MGLRNQNCDAVCGQEGLICNVHEMRRFSLGISELDRIVSAASNGASVLVGTLHYLSAAQTNAMWSPGHNKLFSLAMQAKSAATGTA